MISSQFRLRENSFLQSVAMILICFFIYIFFLITTESRYKDVPWGDAAYYTMMAAHYNAPEKIQNKIPTIYAMRALPSIIVGIGVSSFISPEDRETLVNAAQLQTNSRYMNVNTVVRRGYLVFNGLCHLLTVWLLYRIFLFLGFCPEICFGLPVVFMTFYIPVRLYIYWPQMADPLGFLILASSFYALVRGWLWRLLACLLLTIFVRENNLLLIPSLWTLLFFSKDLSKPRKILWIATSILPLLVFLWFRKHSYFPTEIKLPFCPTNDATNLNLPSLVPDYFFLIFYQFTKVKGWIGALRIGLIFFYTFGPLSFILIAEPQSCLTALRKHSWLVPYFVLTLAAGLLVSVDRYLFYLYPIIFILIAYVINEKLDAFGSKWFLLGTCMLNLVLYSAFSPITDSNILTGDYRLLELLYLNNRSEVIPLAFKTLFINMCGLGAFILLKPGSRTHWKRNGAILQAVLLILLGLWIVADFSTHMQNKNNRIALLNLIPAQIEVSSFNQFFENKENLIDGNPNTYWHARYPKTELESVISIDAKQSVKTGLLRILPRNGFLDQLWTGDHAAWEASADGVNWKLITMLDIDPQQLNQNSWLNFIFQHENKYRYYRLRVRDQQFLSLSELELYVTVPLD